MDMRIRLELGSGSQCELFEVKAWMMPQTSNLLKSIYTCLSYMYWSF